MMAIDTMLWIQIDVMDRERMKKKKRRKEEKEEQDKQLRK